MGFDSLGVRFVDCPNCGKQHDRDINAAINIKHEGKADFGIGNQCYCFLWVCTTKTTGT
ncbi:zinc ribbon domain-containing protein [Microseira sp. BLCC-F43]|uniref:zinc ribbon domain-containing protein n=1 Tax=Microseira sp. BLCC-F43 TaxID=3153602 RepID=UPI0035B9D68C